MIKYYYPDSPNSQSRWYNNKKEAEKQSRKEKNDKNRQK